MNKYIIRQALVTDANAIAGLLNLSYRGEASKEGWTTEADLVGGERTNPGSVEALIRKVGSQFVLCCSSNEILGCMHLNIVDAETLYLGMLAVNPKIQGKGIGKLLIQEARNFARNKSLRKIRMTVINFRPELLAYYNRLGFLSTGMEEDFPMPEHTKVPGIKLLELVQFI